MTKGTWYHAQVVHTVGRFEVADGRADCGFVDDCWSNSLVARQQILDGVLSVYEVRRTDYK